MCFSYHLYSVSLFSFYFHTLILSLYFSVFSLSHLFTHPYIQTIHLFNFFPTHSFSQHIHPTTLNLPPNLRFSQPSKPFPRLRTAACVAPSLRPRLPSHLPYQSITNHPSQTLLKEFGPANTVRSDLMECF